jgi:hypothetical protein
LEIWALQMGWSWRAGAMKPLETMRHVDTTMMDPGTAHATKLAAPTLLLRRLRLHIKKKTFGQMLSLM